MSPKPKKVAPLNGYKLKVEFENGEEKIFDTKPYLLYPVYEDLKNQSLFNEARVEYGTVIWTKDIDVDPDRLYLEGV